MIFFYRIHHILTASSKALRQQITNIEAQRLNREVKDILDDFNQDPERKSQLLTGKRVNLAEELSRTLCTHFQFELFKLTLYLSLFRARSSDSGEAGGVYRGAEQGKVSACGMKPIKSAPPLFCSLGCIIFFYPFLLFFLVQLFTFFQLVPTRLFVGCRLILCCYSTSFLIYYYRVAHFFFFWLRYLPAAAKKSSSVPYLFKDTSAVASLLSFHCSALN